MVVPISVGAPCLAPSPSHFKYLTGKMEPLPSATAQSSGPQGSCSSLFRASFFEESKQMEKLLLKLIGTHGLLEEHWDQTGAAFPCPTDPILLQRMGLGMALPLWGSVVKGKVVVIISSFHYNSEQLPCANSTFGHSWALPGLPGKSSCLSCSSQPGKALGVSCTVTAPMAEPLLGGGSPGAAPSGISVPIPPSWNGCKEQDKAHQGHPSPWPGQALGEKSSDLGTAENLPQKFTQELVPPVQKDVPPQLFFL